MVLGTKKDGTTRFCVDYRKLNNVTQKDAYPLPQIDDTLEALRDSRYFSTLDLYSGYWQVEMDEQDIDKTSFVTRQGLFRFTVMPFGLSNAPAKFQRLMELVLKDLNWKVCLIYLDDVIVYGAGFYPALDRLKIVWKRIREANLKLKPTKCCLMRAEVPFLGHIISREGVGVDPAKTEAMEKRPTPVNLKDVRAFLGLASYYRRYIPGFSTVANLTRQGVDLMWDNVCEGAFRTLKAVLISAPMLAYPTQEGHFTLSTDASDVGIGAVLEQDQEEGGQVVKRVIAYACKTLSYTQCRYCTTNKELLAVVMAIELFRYYLTGRHFTVVTDHASLTRLRNFREPEGMVARWIAHLQPFDFAIVHQPGKHYSHTDGLSRRMSRACKRETCPECKPLQKEDTSQTEMARCYTPTFPYQGHFNEYVEMSEEDATLFWEIDNHPTPDPGDSSEGPALTDGAIPITEEAVPETTIATRSVPNDKPEDPRCTGVCTRPAGDSQDTKPADSACLARVQERAGALTDDTLTPGPPCLQATIGTQTDETTQPRIETLEESETPAILEETVIPRPMQPESNETQREGWRRADIETPDRLEPEFDNLWAMLPFAEATWRPTYRARAVTSADDVDPRVQEVLDLPVLNLAAVQGEDPDLVFIKELL